MKKLRLLSTTAASLLLTAGMASAQTQQKMPERAPAAQQSAPAEKIAPPMNAGKRKAPETTGQNVKSLSPGHDEPTTTGQTSKDTGPGKADVKERSDSSDAAKKSTESKDKVDVRSESKGKADAKSESKSSADVKAKDAESKSGASQKSTESTTEKSSTSGQGSAAGAARLSTEQRTKITTIIKKQKVERVSPAKLNISIRVGERVPSHVHFYPVPVEVVEIYPEWRGYLFILIGDQIVIISPNNHEIVAVLTA